MKLKKPFLICIAGRSSSGKSTVVKNLISLLESEGVNMKNITSLNQDNYYKDNNDIILENRKKINYDHPYAFDTELLLKNLNLLLNNKKIKDPIYNFQTNSRMKKFKIVNPGKIIFLEGIMSYESPEIRNLADLLVFIDIESDVCLSRRLERDIKERKRSFDYIMEQYFTYTKPGYNEFIYPLKKYADIIIPQGGKNKSSLKLFFGNLMWKLSKK